MFVSTAQHQSDMFIHIQPLLLGASQVAPMQEIQETQVRSLGWKDAWWRAWQPTQVLLPGESHGRRSLAGHGP